jgi:homopolymeric O-antigen transport system ATP-binding protein
MIEPAIRAVDLGKRYEIYDRPHLRLLQTLLRGRRRYYREFWALSGVSLEVMRGETLGIVGRNGSGKSTLLQLVAGTLFPSTGSVTVHGRAAALLELGSGFNPEFTGRENVYLNGAILGISSREMDESFDVIVAFSGIKDFIDQPVKTYSSGMLVRLAFSVAVHATPDVLIVDEALAVGDTAFQARCLNRIRELQAAGVAIVLVSHSPNTVIEFCNRAAYLDGGRLRMVGPCRDVLECYADDVVSGEGGVATATSLPVPAAPEPVAEQDLPADGAASAIVAVRLTDARGTEKNCFVHGEEIRVHVDVAFRSENPAPCFGIQVRTVDDIALWATTTALMNRPMPPASAGSRARYRWVLTANMGGNRFVLALGVGDVATGEYLRHHRLRYAGHFDVLPEPAHGTGWLELAPRFELEA